MYNAQTELTSRGGATQNKESDHTRQPLLPETTHDAYHDLPPKSASSLDTGDDQVIPIRAYIILTTAVVALSSIGPSLDLQHGVAPVMKVFWRQTGTWMFLLPFAARSVVKDGFPRLSWTQVGTFLCASFCYDVMCVGFVISLEYTSVGNAVIFSNTHALLLLLGRFFIGASVSLMEGGGALVAFLGGVLCTYDASLVETQAPQAVYETSPIWQGCFGNALAIISALGGVTYLVLAKSVRPLFATIYVFVFLNMVVASVVTLSYIVAAGQPISFSRDIHIGLLGFMNTRYDRFPLECFMVLVCNIVGSMGYLRSTQYFDNLVISVATLMEPVVASFLAYSMGVGVLPGGLGWIGNVLVMLGTFAVLDPRSKKQSSDSD